MPSQCKLQKKFCNLNISAQKDYWIETHIQQFLSFYPQQKRIFQLAAEGLNAVAYNRDRKDTEEGVNEKKRNRIWLKSKRQRHDSVIRPFSFYSQAPESSGCPDLLLLHFMDILRTGDTYRLALKGSVTVSPRYRLIIDAGSLFCSCFDLGYL